MLPYATRGVNCGAHIDTMCVVDPVDKKNIHFVRPNYAHSHTLSDDDLNLTTSAQRGVTVAVPSTASTRSGL